jgi:two-component system, sensor histidine kinase PdtaS
MRPLLSIFILLILSTSVLGQPIERSEADSLFRLLKKAQPNIERIKTLNRLAEFHIFKPGENKVDFDSAVLFLREARQLNQSLESASYAGQLLLTESFMLREKGQQENAKLKVEEAVKTLQSSNVYYHLGKALFELSGYYDYHNPDEYPQKVKFVEASVGAFEKSDGILEKAEALKMLGDLYSQAGDYNKAAEILHQALIAYNTVNHKPLQGVYTLLGGIYSVQNDYKQALYYQLLALKTAERCNDTTIQLCQINSNLAALYSRSSQYEKSLFYYKASLKTAIKYDDRRTIPMTIFSIAKTFTWLNQPDSSLAFLSTIAPHQLQADGTGEKAFIAMSFMEAYLGTRQFSKAGLYCDTLMKLYDDAAIIPAVKSMINRLAASYHFEIKNYDKSRLYLTRNEPITKTLPGAKWLSLDEKMWYKLDSTEGNLSSAFYHLLAYKNITEALFNETKARQFQQLEVEFETSKKEDSLKQKNQDIAVLQQRNELQQANLKQSNRIKNITIAGIILAILTLGLLYYQFRINRKKSKLILQKNEELKNMLAEKEWWLKEVHHRVKNNLHTIICLLESQAMYLEKDALQAIEKSQHRIYAMSLIHQKLYQNEDLQVIDMHIYLEEFIGYLKDSFDTANIEFLINVDPVQLNLQQAIPVALIINEGVTNAIKYAFGSEGHGKIWISMTETDRVKLTITDNGKGFELSEETERKSLGMQLIRGLSKELKGTVLIETKLGTKLEIAFTKGPLTEKIPSLLEDKMSK